MKYISNSKFSHNQSDKIGVLLTNLGTPDAPTPKALKKYLKQFLSDPRVVEVPRLIWWCILNFVILNIRPKRSAHAYSTVWTEDGSPLMLHTQNQTNAVKNALEKKYGDSIIVDFGMRYGNPSIESKLESMLSQGARKVLLLPLYPQYSGSTTGSTFDAIADDFKQRRWLPDFRFIAQYHDNPEYIAAIGDKIKQTWEKSGKAQKLLFSYHGIPKRYLINGDPYHCQCHKTSRLVADYLGLNNDEYLTTFQSRFGREEWLKPYTDHTLMDLPKQGIKSVQMVCPGFSSDCLETIEEIGVENRQYFMEAGGESYEYIECLNSDDNHITMLTNLIEANLQGWSLPSGEDIALRNKLADAMQSD